MAQNKIKPFVDAVVVSISISDLDSLKVVYETVTLFSKKNICCTNQEPYVDAISMFWLFFAWSYVLLGSRTRLDKRRRCNWLLAIHNHR